MANIGDLLIGLPPAAHRLVQRNILNDNIFLRDGLLVLQAVKLTLSVEHIQKVGKPAFIPLRGQMNGTLRGNDRLIEASQPLALRGEIADCVVHFFHRKQNDPPVGI